MLWGSAEPNANGCVIWTGPRTTRPKDKPGPIYGRMTVGGKRIKAHRYAWERVNGPIPDGLGGLHRCDNPLCVAEPHIFPGDDADNNKDRASKGRNADTNGEQNPFAKLTEAQVAEIRTTPRTYGSGIALAERFGVSAASIYSIRSGRGWQHGPTVTA